MASKSMKKRTASCNKKGCGWSMTFVGDKYAVEHAKKQHAELKHSSN